MTKTTVKAVLAVICAAVIAIAAVMTAGVITATYNKRYGESLERINNPDQGFYRPIYVKLTNGGASYNKNIINETTQLYHLRIDISEFSSSAGGTDKPLTDSALNGVRGLLQELKSREKSAIVRFAYDPKFEGKKDMEPADFNVLLGHIRQATAVLNDFEVTVTAIEAGLIGPWGEMHSSKISDSAHTNLLIDGFLKNTENLPVLVRTPKKIYDYLGITVNDIDGYKISPSTPAYRLGLYNDGYLGSGNDLGTYTDREREVEFLSKINEHLPYGGEVVMPDSTFHDIKNCTGEMFKLSLSYLNVEWNDKVIQKWKNTKYTRSCGKDANYYGQSSFTYIENRLGYRFVYKGATLKYTAKSGIFAGQFNIDNVGFGNLTKEKKLKLIFTDEDGSTVYECDAGLFHGESKIGFSQNVKLEKGKYKIYLCVYGEEINGSPAYSVRFANKNIWNENLKANFIGEIKV